MRRVASLPLALGGHGLVPFNLTPSTHHSNPPINQSELALTYHHASFFASWSSTWSSIRAWVPPLRGESFPSATNLSPNSPPLPPFKAQVLNTWWLINAASARPQHHPYRSYLPSHYTAPSFFHPLLDGERTDPHLSCHFLLNSPPITFLQIPRAASYLLLSLTSNLPPKSKLKLLSPHLCPPSPFWTSVKPRLTGARRDSLMAPLSKDRRRGML